MHITSTGGLGLTLFPPCETPVATHDDYLILQEQKSMSPSCAASVRVTARLEGRQAGQVLDNMPRRQLAHHHVLRGVLQRKRRARHPQGGDVLWRYPARATVPRRAPAQSAQGGPPRASRPPPLSAEPVAAEGEEASRVAAAAARCSTRGDDKCIGAPNSNRSCGRFTSAYLTWPSRGSL
eukprot:scaffold8736_cov114-Isochrysis_galbana.AAC.11